jgi:hypothetical protein
MTNVLGTKRFVRPERNVKGVVSHGCEEESEEGPCEEGQEDQEEEVSKLFAVAAA